MNNSPSSFIEKLYKNRFELFLATQLAILFGSLFFPADLFEYRIQPVLFLLNIAAGISLMSKSKKLLWFFTILFVASLVIFGFDMTSREEENMDTILIRLSIYFLFYFVVTINIIKQVWHSKKVNKNVMIGLMSGYISLGFLAFCLFMSIELVNPGAFQGMLLENELFRFRADAIMYYSYITLLTIGYGEIVPVIPIAQKAAILVGLVGQFYLVIITAVVIEKYIRHSHKLE